MIGPLIGGWLLAVRRELLALNNAWAELSADSRSQWSHPANARIRAAHERLALLHRARDAINARARLEFSVEVKTTGAPDYSAQRAHYERVTSLMKRRAVD
jgi:hypothetical protein